MLDRVIGSYQVTSRIGAGCMGVIYQAKHLTLGRTVAIKVLRPELSIDRDAVTRFFDEVRAVSAIRNPAIIEVLECGVLDDRSAYVVTEYLEGHDLAARIRRPRSSVLSTLTVLREIALALHAAHERGIVHGDLKPDNVFVLSDGEVGRIKLLDFGLPKLLSRDRGIAETDTGPVVGTPAYMAPEQFDGSSRGDRRTDLYSLGCIAYELLTGRPPFFSSGAPEMISHHLRTEPSSVRSHRVDVITAVDALVLRLLQKTPAARPATALDVARELDRLAELPELINTAPYPRSFAGYDLLEEVDQDHAGMRYLAVHRRDLARLLVITTTQRDAEYAARFLVVGQVLVQLSHANLVRVLDTGQLDGHQFLATELVDGRDLRALWNRCAKKQVAIPIEIAVYIVKELCFGLAYLHGFSGVGLVHRDVSPPDVVVSYDGEVRLTAFGLATCSLHAEPRSKAIYGRTPYLSPEQARGEPLDGRSDLYAAALVLWELLTGRQAFPAGRNRLQDLQARAASSALMPPSKRAPRVPVTLDRICVTALAPSRTDRYRDCDALHRELTDWLAEHAPDMNRARLSRYLHDLFRDDIPRERTWRDELLDRARAGLSSG